MARRYAFILTTRCCARIALSEPDTVYPLDEGTDVGEFFRKAVISDADGKVVKEIENTRVNSAGSQVAIGCRNMHVQVDNIVVTDYTAPSDPCRSI